MQYSSSSSMPYSLQYILKFVPVSFFSSRCANIFLNIARLLQVEILGKLDHINVVKIYHFFPYEIFHFFIVLEYLEGGKLLDRVVSKVILSSLLLPLRPAVARFFSFLLMYCVMYCVMYCIMYCMQFVEVGGAGVGWQ